MCGCVVISAPSLSCSSTSVSVTCSWTPASNTYVCANTSIYYYVCFGPQNAAASCTQVPYSNVSYTNSNLQPCTAYTFSVMPLVNDSYFGVMNGIVASSVITTSNSPPNAPGSFNAPTVTSSSISVTWTAPSVVYCPLTNYSISYTTTGVPNNAPCSNSSVSFSASTTSSTLTGLCACRTYSIALAAQTQSGYGPSLSTTATTSAATPASVSSLTLNTSSTAVTASWQADSGTCYVTYNVSLSLQTSTIQSISTNCTSALRIVILIIEEVYFVSLLELT